MTETFFTYAKPKITNVNSYVFEVLPLEIIEFQNFDIVVKGNRFLNIRNVYLSGSNSLMFNNVSCFDIFGNIKNLSANNLPFSGINVGCFTYNENFLYFKVPQLPKTTGFFDIIVENEAGYGKLSEGSKVPYVSSYFGDKDIQLPCISGIQVKIW
jgi:hypothetical protein